MMERQYARMAAPLRIPHIRQSFRTSKASTREGREARACVKNLGQEGAVPVSSRAPRRLAMALALRHLLGPSACNKCPGHPLTWMLPSLTGYGEVFGPRRASGPSAAADDTRVGRRSPKTSSTPFGRPPRRSRRAALEATCGTWAETCGTWAERRGATCQARAPRGGDSA